MSDHDDEEAAGEAHRAAQGAYCDEVEALQSRFPDEKISDLNEALYVFNERGFFDGDVELGADNALKAWALVERLKAEGFPAELRM